VKVYEAMSLGELITKLKEIGEAPVRGLDGEVDSYRGYYERNATTPCDSLFPASTLANAYRSEVGKAITGWKGGEYTVSAGELIYYAQQGSTGPAICGLELGADGVYELVGVVENFW
jgi:hypothetical protein